jgi:hypothetical protein
MKKIILRYGSYAAIFEFLFFVLAWLILDLVRVSHQLQGFIGLIVITCPLIFVYFGIRYYRDKLNNETITFLQALKIGLLIVIIPAVSYALIETIYVLIIDPKFYENVAAYDIEQYRKSLSSAQFAIKLKEIKQQVVLDNNPFYNFSVLVLMIGALGTIITIISALLLKRKLNYKPLTQNV